MIQTFKELLPYAISAITALFSFLTVLFVNKTHKAKEKMLEEQLERAKSRETYVKCPKCNEHIPLSEVNFYLPGDIRDNNLNGKDDSTENL